MNGSNDLLRHQASAGAMLGLIRSGQARSRAEIARVTGLSPTTVAQRIDVLIDAGYVREAGMGVSQGGRRPRALEVDPTTGVVCAVDLGSQHATFGLLDLSGRCQVDLAAELDRRPVVTHGDVHGQ